MNTTTVGIDLAKNVFQVHGIDARGKVVLRKQLRREQVAVYFGNLPPCLIGVEACATAHHWGRRLERLGHTVRLMAPQFVKPYVKTNKNDAADAEAICEAVSRPNMRFVPIKSIEQQAILSVHRARQGFIEARTAQANQIRGLLGEFGLVIPQGICHVAQRVPALLEDAGNELPLALRQLIDRLTCHLKELDQQVRELERQIIAWHRGSELSRKLEKIPGIGPLAATALVASIADASSFDNGRQVSAWLGLVPRQSSSGGKSVLLGMSKRGDVYLRTLLIHGARSAILAARRQKERKNVWLTNLLDRRHANIAAVALANKNVRTVWALLAHGRDFKPDYLPVPAA
ncbi:MAG: transposase [Gammaproteobacteria bacterium SG8_30]|jgi:transposase|nr:MAG: transposase [Gammaproteobacteria bacterium SG8_30]